LYIRVVLELILSVASKKYIAENNFLAYN